MVRKRQGQKLQPMVRKGVADHVLVGHVCTLQHQTTRPSFKLPPRAHQREKALRGFNSTFVVLGVVHVPLPRALCVLIHNS